MPTEPTSRDIAANQLNNCDEIFQVYPNGNEISSSPTKSICSIQAHNKAEKPTNQLNLHIASEGDYKEPAQTYAQTVDDTLISGDHQGLISSDLEEYGDNLVAQIINDLLEQF